MQMKGNEYQEKSNIDNSLERRRISAQKFRQNWQSILNSVGLMAKKFQVYFLFIMLTTQGIIFIEESVSDKIDTQKLIGGVYLILLSFFWCLILIYIRKKKKSKIQYKQKPSNQLLKSPKQNYQQQQMNCSNMYNNQRISQQFQNQNQQEAKSTFQPASSLNKQTSKNHNSKSSLKIQQKERNSQDMQEKSHKKQGYYNLVRDLCVVIFSTPALIYIYEYFLKSMEDTNKGSDQTAVYYPKFWSGILTFLSFKLFISRLKIPIMQIFYFLSGYSYFILKYWICCDYQYDTIVISLVVLLHDVTIQASDIFKIKVYSFFKKYSKHTILFEALRLTVEQGNPNSDLENDLASRFIKLQSQKRENEAPLNFTPKDKSQSIQLAQQNSIQNKFQQYNPQQINEFQISKGIINDKNQSATSFLNNTSFPLKRQETFNQRINDLKKSGFYSQLFSLIPVGVAIISSGKNLLYASTQMLQMLNCQDEQKALKILLNLNTNAQKSTQCCAEEEVESEDDQYNLNGQTDYYTSSINANYNSIFNGYNNNTSDKKIKKEYEVSNSRFTPPQLNQRQSNGFQLNNQSIRDNSLLPSGLVEEERSSRYMIDEEEYNAHPRKISMNMQNMNGQSYSNNNSIIHVSNSNYKNINFPLQQGNFKESQQVSNALKSPQNSVNETMIEIGTERNNLISTNQQLNQEKQYNQPFQQTIPQHSQSAQNKKFVQKTYQNLSSKDLIEKWVTEENIQTHQVQQPPSSYSLGRTSHPSLSQKHLQQNQSQQQQQQQLQQQQQDSLGDTDKQIIEEDELGQTQSIINPELQLNELQFQKPEYSKINSPKSGLDSNSQKKRGSGIMRNNLRQMSQMRQANDNGSDNKTEAQQREESVLNILNIMLGWQDQQQNSHTTCQLQNQQVSSAKIKSQKKIINQQVYYTSTSGDPDMINSPVAASIGHQIQSTTYGKVLSYNQSTIATHSLNQIQAKQPQDSTQNEFISNSLAKQIDVNREKQPVKISQLPNQHQVEAEQGLLDEQNPAQEQNNAKQISCQNNVQCGATQSNNTGKKKQGEDTKDFDELLKQKQQLGYIQQEGNVSTMQIEYLGEQYILKIIIHHVIVGSSGEQQKVAMIVMEKMWQDFMIKKVEDLIKQKMQLFGSLSHELRTPLNCSISMMEVLQNIAQSDSKISNQLSSYIQPALNSNKLLLNMINDILDFVQLENGSFKFGFVEFDLQNLLKECVSLVQIQAKMKNLTIACYYDPQTPKIIKSDPNRIRQVILNFLSNALKFTITGHIIVYASAHKGVREVTIGVKDTGIGINQENINEIFKIFNKIDLGNNQKLNLQGCGVGLALSNSIARALGPEDNQGIQVQSEKNHGSNFSFIVQNQNPAIQNNEEDIYENEDVSNERLFANFSIIRPKVTQINKENNDLLQSFQPKRRNSAQSLNSNQTNLLMQSKSSARQMKIQSQNSNSNQISNCLCNSIVNGYQNNNTQPAAHSHSKTLTNLNAANMNGQNDGMSFSSDNSLQMNGGETNLKMRSISLTQVSSHRKNIINSYSTVAQEQQSPREQQLKPKQAFHYFYNNNNSTIGNPQSPSRNHSYNQQTSFLNAMSVGDKKISLLETIKSKDFQDIHLLDHQKYESPAGFNSYYEEKDSQIVKKSLECIQNNIIQFGCNCPQILIVDDQEFNLFSLSQLLKQFYNIISDTAVNCSQVMEKIQNKLNSKCCRTYRIIFMDINMPQKSGYEVAREIKYFYNTNEILEKVKPTIIACSAYNGEEDKKKAYNHGMVDFVTKPIMKAALDVIISKYYDSVSLIPQQLLNN